jgi:RraA family protein
MTAPVATGPSVRVAPRHERPPAGVVERFRGMPACTVADAQERLWVLDSGIRPMWTGGACVGPALPVYTRAGDNLAVHHALDLVEPGDVLVVNGQGDTSRALVGEMIAARAFQSGLAGLVVDGAVRDVAALAAIGLPIFARAATPAGPYKHGPAEIGYPVACGGVVCAPGDIICGDADGVVVVPQARVAQVAERVDEVVQHEHELARRWGRTTAG